MHETCGFIPLVLRTHKKINTMDHDHIGHCSQIVENEKSNWHWVLTLLKQIELESNTKPVVFWDGHISKAEGFDIFVF